jgi:hypothetical protein
MNHLGYRLKRCHPHCVRVGQGRLSGHQKNVTVRGGLKVLPSDFEQYGVILNEA